MPLPEGCKKPAHPEDGFDCAGAPAHKAGRNPSGNATVHKIGLFRRAAPAKATRRPRRHSALAAAVNPAHDAPMPSAGKAAWQASLFPAKSLNTG
jgi:hypothetical protein